MAFVIELSKENFKFSGTHFTIFNAAQAERLHGHNYYVSVQIEVRDIQDDIGMSFDFNLVKPIIKSLCESWDERVLIPRNSPFLKIQNTQDSFEIQFNQKRYVFPEDDVMMLPITNVTVEELARLIGLRLFAQLNALPTFPAQKMNWLSVGVQETHGQRVVYRHEVHPPRAGS